MYEYEITKQIKQMTKGTIISDKDGEQYLYKITQNCDNLVKYIHLIVHGGSYERY